jgi:hypothetical protein
MQGLLKPRLQDGDFSQPWKDGKESHLRFMGPDSCGINRIFTDGLKIKELMDLANLNFVGSLTNLKQYYCQSYAISVMA